MRWFKRLLWLCLVCVLLITNVITATTVILSNAISGLMGATLGRTGVPRLSTPALRSSLEADNKRLKDRLTSHRASVTSLGQGATQRAKRMAMFNLAETSLGAVPIAGATLLIAGVVWELSQLCDGLKDVDQLYQEMEIEEGVDSEVLGVVCLSDPLKEDSDAQN